jgi:PAS domain S-box-containing protein
MPLPAFADTTVFVTCLLAAILHLLYRRLRQEEFLRWWAWAWTSYAVSIVARWAMPVAPQLEVVWFAAGWLHVPLLFRGARAIGPGNDGGAPASGRIAVPAILTVATLAGVANYYWAAGLTDAARYAVTLTPRVVLYGAVYGYSAAKLWQRRRTDASRAVVVTMLACAVRAALFLVLAWSALRPLILGGAPAVEAWVNFAGLLSQVGIALGVILILIREHQTAEQRLSESQAQYRRIVETASEGIWLADTEGRTLFVNRRVEEFLGCAAAELVGRRPWELPVSGGPSEEEIKRIMAERRAGRSGRYEIQTRRPDGQERWLQISATPVFGSGGEFAGSLSMLTDISDVKRAEAALRVSEARYRELFENAGDLVYTRDLRGNFTSWNRTAELISGYSRAEALRMNIRDIAAPAYRAQVERWLREEPAREGRTRMDIISKDGRILHMEISHRPVLEAGKAVAVQSIARDITARLNLETQLRQAQKMEALGRLAGGVAHDFNNLLGVILGYSDLLAHRLPEGPDRAKMEQVSEAARRGATLTRQLLAFSRKQFLDTQPLSLNALISDLSAILRRLLGEPIRLELQLDPAAGIVRADPGQMQQVILNLASNARDAMPDGGRLRISTRNLQRTLPGRAAPAWFVELAVHDTGAGMDEQTQRHAFDPFFTTKPRGRGTGLGLATVHGVVEQSGGVVELSSAPGAGATFRILLPRVDATLPAAAPATPVESTGDLSGDTVILAEDEAPLREMITAVLAGAGFHVLAAGSGGEALRLAAAFRGPVRALVTDVIMPEINGRQLAARVRELRPDIKVLYISGYTGETIEQHGEFEDGAAFLQKPFAAAHLVSRLRQILDQPIAV